MNTPMIYEPGQWQVVKEQAQMLVRSGLLPESVNTPEKAVAIAMKGHEIGMPMMQAFSQIHVIKGKPTLSAEGINSLIRKNCPKATLDISEHSEDKCTIKASRPGSKESIFTFSMADAKKAGITGNPSWTKYPRQMLFARCITEVGRTMFPDCLSGISYVPEEMGAEVDDTGEVVHVIAETPKEPEPEIFDSKNIQHVSRLTKYLLSKGYTDDDTIAVMKLMEGKPSAIIFDVLEAYDKEVYKR